MEIGNIASLATGMAQERTRQDIGVAVLKKAMDVQASGAMALIEAIPVVPASPPANQGQYIDTTA